MSRTFRLGVFIVGTLLILAAGVFLIGDKEFLFSSTFPLKADFQNVAGLNVGADVRVGGDLAAAARKHWFQSNSGRVGEGPTATRIADSTGSAATTGSSGPRTSAPAEPAIRATTSTVCALGGPCLQWPGSTANSHERTSLTEAVKTIASPAPPLLPLSQPKPLASRWIADSAYGGVCFGVRACLIGVFVGKLSVDHSLLE